MAATRKLTTGAVVEGDTWVDLVDAEVDGVWLRTINRLTGTAGTSTAYTATASPDFVAGTLVFGTVVVFVPHVACGASPTLNIDGLGAFEIVKPDGSSDGADIIAGDLIANNPYTLEFRDTYFMLLSTLGSAFDAATSVEFDALQSEVVTARSGEATLDVRIDGVSIMATATRDEVQNARDIFANLDARLDSERNTLQAGVTAVSNEVVNARDAYANLDARLDSERSTLQANITTVSNEVIAARSGATTLDERIDDVHDQAVATHDEVLNARDTFPNLDARLDSERNTLQSGITATANEVVNARDTFPNLDARLDSERNTLQTNINTEASTRATVDGTKAFKTFALVESGLVTLSHSDLSGSGVTIGVPKATSDEVIAGGNDTKAVTPAAQRPQALAILDKLNYHVSVTGGPTDFIGTAIPVMQRYASGQTITFVLPVNAASGARINIDSLGWKDLRKSDGASFATGELPAGPIYTFSSLSPTRWCYVNWQMGTVNTQISAAVAAEAAIREEIDNTKAFKNFALVGRGLLTVEPTDLSGPYAVFEVLKATSDQVIGGGNDTAAVTSAAMRPLMLQFFDKLHYVIATTGGPVDYVGTSNPTMPRYASGQSISLVFPVTPEPGARINIDSHGFKTFSKSNGANFDAGDLRTGVVYHFQSVEANKWRYINWQADEVEASAGGLIETAIETDKERERNERALALALPVRPGEMPFLWSQETIGPVADRTPLPDSLVVTDTNGAVIRINAAGIYAPRLYYRIEPGRVYRVRGVAQRRTNPLDPASDAVRLSVQWLTKTLSSAGVATVQTKNDLNVAAGRWEFSGVIARAVGEGVNIVAPSSAIYLTPFFEIFGSPVSVDIEVMDWADLTDASLYSPDLTALQGEVDALTSANLPTRVTDLEAATSGSEIKWYKTRADAVAAATAGTIAPDVDVIETYAYADDATAFGGVKYVWQAGAPAVGSDSFADSTGGYWVAGIPERIAAFKTVAEMAARPGAAYRTGDTILVLGKAAPMDGGQGQYVYVASGTADGVVVVAPADGVGRFVRREWNDDNVILARWWGLVLNDTAAQTANGTALGMIFDFVAATNEGGECIFPQGLYYVQRATAYTWAEQRGWRFRGAGDSGLNNSGTRFYLMGGGMDWFIKYRSVLQFHWSDMQFFIGVSGMAGVFDVGAENYYNGDGFTPIGNSGAISSYLCSWTRMTFSSDVASSCQPTVAHLWLHATVSCNLDTLWLTGANRILKFGEAGLLATDPDGNTLAKGSCGQIRVSNCLMDGDIGYMRMSNVSFLGGQMSVGPGGRAAILEQMSGADICHAINFSCMSIGGVGDHSAPFLSSTIATNVVIGRDCVVGRFNTVAVADGDAKGWDISPTVNINTQGKPTDGILKVLSTCTGTDFACNTPAHPDLIYTIKDERVQPQVLSVAQAAAPRSLLHNSKFDVWRRGTSFAPVAQIFEADRWKGRRGGAESGSTHTRQTGFRGAQYCLRAQRDSGNATVGALLIGQQIFSADCYALQGKTLFISADMRAGANLSAATGITLVVYSGTGIDEVGTVGSGFTTGNVAVTVGTKPITTTAATIDFGSYVVPTNATELLFSFRATPSGAAGAADYFEMTNVNVTVGYKPSPYVSPSATAEEAATAPYCQKSFIRTTAPAQGAGTSTGELRGVMAGTGAVVNYITYPLEQRMWSTPSFVLYNPVSANNQVYNMTDAEDCSGVNFAGVTDRGLEILYTGNNAGIPGDRVGVHFLATAGV